jgi:hypothetical protein
VTFSLVILHPLNQVELEGIGLHIDRWRVGQMDTSKERATLEDGDLCLLEYFCNVLLTDEVEGQRFVGVIPGVGHSI